MSAIGPGTRVKCIRPTKPMICRCGCGEQIDGPAYGSAWTVADVFTEYPVDLIELREWPRSDQLFDLRWFAPIDGDAELAKLAALAKRPQRVLDYEPVQ